MGLELLEEKYQSYTRQYPENVARLKELTQRVIEIQTDMRKLLDDITPLLCKDCKAPCCQCMPVEGWFTESDYFLYRMRYDAPFDLKVDHGLERGCAFLGETGCVLPGDIRPFPCVKVNCESVSRELERRGRLETFKKLFDALAGVQEEVWPLLEKSYEEWYPGIEKPA